jgi:hypothetical protein
MCKAWVGFNASHSVGLIAFGAVYADLALAHGEVLFASPFLLALGLLVLLGYALLARAYFFRAPLRGMMQAVALYAMALAAARS